MGNFIQNHKKLVIIGLVLLVLIFIGTGVNNSMKAKKQEEEKDKLTDELLQEAQASGNTSDNLLLQMQPELIDTYGKLPEGYIWDIDGSLLSLGDKSMSAEEVVYSYLNGLRTLDLSTAQKYSRGSTAIKTYEGYFSETNKNTDYTDSFLRNMYRESLLSFQIQGVNSSSIFAENKQVFTVKVEMLDLTQKDFWQEDKDEIYKNLRSFTADESDNTKADMYLYDYILEYYSSDDAKLRNVTFDLTVQRYPDLDTGWLVSIDTDIDSACRYADGKLVVSYINERYRDEGKDYLEENFQNGNTGVEDTLPEEEELGN